MTIEEAFHAADRRNFLPEDVRHHADADIPLPIGYGQTNSQPSTVRLMLEWLEVEEGNMVLDVGSGSGWTTALLSKLAGQAGHVYAVELIPELVAVGRENYESIGLTNAEFHEAGKTYGLPEHAPYDRILVSASAHEIPDELIAQLKAPGRMVVPFGDTIYEIEKSARGEIEAIPHGGFRFVPLVGG